MPLIMLGLQFNVVWDINHFSFPYIMSELMVMSISSNKPEFCQIKPWYRRTRRWIIRIKTWLDSHWLVWTTLSRSELLLYTTHQAVPHVLFMKFYWMQFAVRYQPYVMALPSTVISTSTFIAMAHIISSSVLFFICPNNKVWFDYDLSAFDIWTVLQALVPDCNETIHAVQPVLPTVGQQEIYIFPKMYGLVAHLCSLPRCCVSS